MERPERPDYIQSEESFIKESFDFMRKMEDYCEYLEEVIEKYKEQNRPVAEDISRIDYNKSDSIAVSLIAKRVDGKDLPPPKRIIKEDVGIGAVWSKFKSAYVRWMS